MWSVGIVAAILIAAVLASLATQAFSSSASQIENTTGPVLISTQELVASIAEADAANTAVFLSGNEQDRQQQSLFEEAMGRAPQRIEDISAGVEDDASHDALKRVGSQLTEYGRLAERARLGNLAGEQSAVRDLGSALELVSGPNGMIDNAELISDRTQEGFNDEITSGNTEWIGAITALVVALVAILLAQINLKNRTNRLLNIPLVIATVCIVALGIWLSLALLGRTNDLEAARSDAYESIALTADLQTSAFEYKTREARAIINDDPTLLESDETLGEIDRLLTELEASADSVREQAAVTNLRLRWQRYVDTSTKVANALSSNDTAAARTIAISEGNRDFNGFNTTVETVLLKNRDQFDANVDSSVNRLRWLQLGAILLPLLAIAMTLVGYQARINEYW